MSWKTPWTRCALVGLLATGCVSPRSVVQTGRVTPAGNIKISGHVSGNVPTATMGAVYDGLEDQIRALAEEDAKVDDEAELNRYAEPLLMNSLDPVSFGYDLGARAGVVDHVDVGYKYASGVHVIDSMVQFMGPVGEGRKETSERWYGAAGLQYSHQSYELPSWLGFDKLQRLLDYRFERTDLLLPVVFSYSFGADEKYGALGFGLAYNYTRLNYGFESESLGDLLEDQGALQQNIPGPNGKSTIHSYGTFINVKFGYKVYGVVSLAAYYQNYGRYELFASKTKEFSGLTLVPAAGLEFEF